MLQLRSTFATLIIRQSYMMHRERRTEFGVMSGTAQSAELKCPLKVSIAPLCGPLHPKRTAIAQHDCGQVFDHDQHIWVHKGRKRSASGRNDRAASESESL
jgi:hypothetical protein